MQMQLYIEQKLTVAAGTAPTLTRSLEAYGTIDIDVWHQLIIVDRLSEVTGLTKALRSGDM